MLWIAFPVLHAQSQPGVGARVVVPIREIQQARGWFSSNQAPRALATLAAALRSEPANQLIAEELLVALTERNFPRLLEVSNAPSQSIAYAKPAWRSPDDKYSLDRGGELSAIQSGKPVGTPLRHGTGIRGAWFSPDGQRVGTTSADSAQIWDATTGLALSPLLKHRSQVNSARFSPDGRWLATGSCDGTAQLWDAFTGAPVSEPMYVVQTNRMFGIVPDANFVPDQHRLLVTMYNRTQEIFVFDTLPGNALREPGQAADRSLVPPGMTASAPGWLPDLAEAMGGMRLNAQLRPDNVPYEERLKVLQQLKGAAETPDPWSRWVKWFLANRSTRSISPVSAMTVPEYIQRRIQENTLASIQEAVRLSPTNGLAFARLAKLTLTQDDKTNPRHIGEADFYSKWALKWSPNDAEVLTIHRRIQQAMAARLRDGTNNE